MQHFLGTGPIYRSMPLMCRSQHVTWTTKASSFFFACCSHTWDWGVAKKLLKVATFETVIPRLSCCQSGDWVQWTGSVSEENERKEEEAREGRANLIFILSSAELKWSFAESKKDSFLFLFEWKIEGGRFSLPQDIGEELFVEVTIAAAIFVLSRNSCSYSCPIQIAHSNKLAEFSF